MKYMILDWKDECRNDERKEDDRPYASIGIECRAYMVIDIKMNPKKDGIKDEAKKRHPL